MKSDLFEKIHKNSFRWRYYAKNLAGLSVPRVFYRRQLDKKIESINFHCDKEKDEILKRVEYYNKLNASFLLDEGVRNSDFKVRAKKSAYHFDFYNIIKFFPKDFYYCYQFGDKTKVPDDPSFIKSRPVDKGLGNQNSVILNLDKLRHYYRIDDVKPYEKKKNMAVWRGAAHQKHRQEFLKACYGSELLDVGAVDGNIATEPFRKAFMSLRDQLQYKFVLSVEGNDVATNLKWIMSSNSICIMRRPRYETWFMEGRLIPGVHYVEVKDDYSDTNEKIEHYLNNQDEAGFILENAKKYANKFYNKDVEELVSLLVVDKYYSLCENC